MLPATVRTRRKLLLSIIFCLPPSSMRTLLPLIGILVAWSVPEGIVIMGPKKGPGLICRNGPEGASHKLNLVPFSARYHGVSGLGESDGRLKGLFVVEEGFPNAARCAVLLRAGWDAVGVWYRQCGEASAVAAITGWPTWLSSRAKPSIHHTAIYTAIYAAIYAATVDATFPENTSSRCFPADAKAHTSADRYALEHGISASPAANGSQGSNPVSCTTEQSDESGVAAVPCIYRTIEAAIAHARGSAFAFRHPQQDREEQAGRS